MTLEPPTYSPSAAVPPYSIAPGPSERTLAATARSRRRTPTGVLTRSNRFIAVALRGQEENAMQPSYGHNSVVSGDIGLSCTQGVHSVCVNLEGRLHLADSEGARVMLTFLNISYDIWRNDGSGTCPTMFPFEFAMPEVFTDNGQRRPLPPTYSVPSSDASGIRAQCYYSLSVIVERRGSKLGLWKPHKKLTVPFIHRPRLQPQQPILSSPFPFLATIKSLPEEWFQVTNTMPAKVKSAIRPIDCHLFIPAVQTFSLTDSIPFYLQLIGPPKSLEAFLYPTIPNHTKLKRSKSNAAETTTPPVVRVYLTRQVTVVLRGHRSTRKFAIGEGTIRSLPPSVSAPTLDYEGEVHASSDVTVGQFGISRLQVRDFITVHLAPPNQYTSQLGVLQHSHPIRLVTDSFMDNVDHEAHVP
ncbi:hypothetical protein B0F90DRAFT_1809172 [Multifurca ochricompacta]|uniref:Arrestin-like N-terminal domain-containing protein n=1 Tax=Multifurca ochricompacta TaxID=376703 RepID=A0AAD4M7G1_9AGAM|nr:hypothetical protein B0F90DRAFT_1809172 [Multifurca ochricompacta]